MRTSAAVLSFGLGIAVPCIAAVWGMDAPIQFYLTLGGASFGVGLIIAAVLDILDWRADQSSLLRQREAMTDATLIANLEREARLKPTVPAVETPRDTTQEWYGAIETFLMAGDVRGFSIRKMSGVVGSDVWEQLTTMLADAGWLVKVPGRGYQWADGYTLARAITELRSDRLPYPTGPAPVVNVPVHNTTLRNTTRHSATVVIDA